MKIAIIGYSGAGKSTLAVKLASFYGVDTLHLDSVQFLPGWQERPLEDKQRIVGEFLAAHDGWVIDGNYSALHYKQRMEEADLIIMLLFDRISCLWRVTRRYIKFRGTTRPDMGPGCSEKLDGEFIWWVLHKGRTRKKRARYKALYQQHKNKSVIIRNQRQLDRWIRKTISETKNV